MSAKHGANSWEDCLAVHTSRLNDFLGHFVVDDRLSFTRTSDQIYWDGTLVCVDGLEIHVRKRQAVTIRAGRPSIATSCLSRWRRETRGREIGGAMDSERIIQDRGCADEPASGGSDPEPGTRDALERARPRRAARSGRPEVRPGRVRRRRSTRSAASHTAQGFEFDYVGVILSPTSSTGAARHAARALGSRPRTPRRRRSACC